jgi:hypothetical protein
MANEFEIGVENIMTMTVTRRQNLIKAIRKGLLLRYNQASRVVDANWMNLACMEPRPLHELTVVPNQSEGDRRGDWSGSAYLYIGDEYLCFIEVPAGMMKPVLTASLARAYGLPDELTEYYEAQLEAEMRRPFDIPASPFALDMAA